MASKVNKEKVPNIFEIIYFCFFLLLPFIYSDKLVDPVLLPRQLFLSIFIFIISCVICYQIYFKKLTVDFSFLKLPVFLLFFLFLFNITISFFKSIVLSESIYILSKVSMEFVFFIVTTYLLIQKKLRVIQLINAVIIFSIASVLISVAQFIKLSISNADLFDNMLQLNATFGHKNLLASILFLTFPFLLYLIVLKKGNKLFLVLFAFLILALVWLLQTKAVILALFAFFFIFLVGVVKYQKRIIDKRLIRVISILTFTLLLLAGVITILKKDKFSRIFDQNSGFERLALWENSESMIKEKFLLGVGAGNWQINFPKYGLDKFQMEEVKTGLTTFQRPHNDFLWVFCEMGFVGLLIYLSIFITVVYQLIQLFKKYKDQELSWLYLILLATCIGYTIIAFFDFPFERVEHQILLFVLFSIVSSLLQ